MFNGFLLTSSTYNYNECGTAEETFDGSVQPDEVIIMASDGSDSNDVSTERVEDGPCTIDLNKVPVMIGDNRTQFE